MRGSALVMIFASCPPRMTFVFPRTRILHTSRRVAANRALRHLGPGTKSVPGLSLRTHPWPRTCRGVVGPRPVVTMSGSPPCAACRDGTNASTDPAPRVLTLQRSGGVIVPTIGKPHDEVGGNGGRV